MGDAGAIAGIPGVGIDVEVDYADISHTVALGHGGSAGQRYGMVASQDYGDGPASRVSITFAPMAWWRCYGEKEVHMASPQSTTLRT